MYVRNVFKRILREVASRRPGLFLARLAALLAYLVQRRLHSQYKADVCVA